MRPQGSAETITIMSKDLDTGSVREARMEAKKLARKGAHTHQQALDHVARDRGHRNWSAFLSSEGQGGTRGARTDERKPRLATSRDLVEATETGFLEDAADLRHEHPSWPLRLVTVLGGAGWLVMMLQWVPHLVSGIVAMSAYLALTLLAGKVAETSPDGLMSVRRSIRSIGSAAGVILIATACAITAWGFAYYGHHDALGHGIRHPLFEQAGLAYTVGVTALITARRMHRVMTIAVPDSVRPSSREDVVMYVDEPVVERPRVRAALVAGMLGGTAIAAAGAVALIGTAVAMFITHEMSMTALDLSIGGLGAGVVIAMAAMSIFMLVDNGRPPVVSAARPRASRARRLLGAASRRPQTD